MLFRFRFARFLRHFWVINRLLFVIFQVIDKFQVGLSYEIGRIKVKIWLRRSVISWGHFLGKFLLLSVLSFPIFGTSWPHSLYFRFYFLILKLYKPLFLAFVMVFSSKVPLEFIETCIFAIFIDNFWISFIDIRYSISHPFIFHIYWVPLIDRKVSIILLLLDNIDSIIEISWEMVLDFRPSCLNILIVICFILKKLV